MRGSLDHALEPHVYQALVMGVRDYVGKNGFPGVLLGLSGGVDSALTLAVAVDALGADRVRAVMMPSHYTRAISLEDAREMAGDRRRALRRDRDRADVRRVPATSLAGEFAGLRRDATEENIQARIRGTLLMALSNKFGVDRADHRQQVARWPSATATLYGDMAGGFAVLKDISKTLVYRLCHYRNSARARVDPRAHHHAAAVGGAAARPDRPGHLPPYDVLDAILERYVEHDQRAGEIVALGFRADDVRKRRHALIKINEYKRRQAPVGIRITPRGFGKDWRYPITSAWNEWESVGGAAQPRS